MGVKNKILEGVYVLIAHMKKRMKTKNKVLILSGVLFAILLMFFAFKVIIFTENWVNRYYNLFEQNLSVKEAEVIPTEIASDNIIDELTNKNVVISINGFPIKLDLSKNKITISADSLNTEYKNSIEFENDNDVQIKFNGTAVNEKKYFLTPELEKEKCIPVEIKLKDLSRIYYLQTLPDSFPEIELAGFSDNEGDYYSNFIIDSGDSYVYKLNNEGVIIFYYKKNCEGAGSLMNFQKHVIEGKVFYSFFEPLKGNYIKQVGINFGQINILNSKYEIIEHLQLEPTDILPVGGLAENHEFLFLGRGHYIITGSIDTPTYIPEFKSYSRVKAAYIQEIKDGDVVFEWSSTEDPNLFCYSVESNDWSNCSTVSADYVHINSVEVDPRDNNLIVSLRNADTIIKIERESGKTLWYLGGSGDQFHLTEAQKFSKQHYAKILSDGSLLFFDNGNSEEQTRIIRFWLDEKNKNITNSKIYIIEGKFSPACGSVQCLDEGKDIYFIGWGMKVNNWAIATEIDFQNQKILTEIIADKNYNSYRTLKIK